MMTKIGIIGTGAVGTAVLAQLIALLKNKPIAHNVAIFLFEKSPDLAQGGAYRDDHLSNLLNRPADKMSIRHEDDHDFIEWLKRNTLKITHAYPDFLALNDDLYLPRPLFGLYLKDTLRLTLQQAEALDIDVTIVKAEVTQVKAIGHVFTISTANNQQWHHFDHVVLSTGHSSDNKFKALHTVPNFINSPYPTKTLTTSIHDKSRSIGILGSRLSAIDAAIALVESGHTGKMYFLSRNRFLPAIRANQTVKLPPIQPPVGLNSLLKIKQFLENIISQHVGTTVSFDDWLNRPKDPIAFLQYELTHSKQLLRATWDTLLFESNHLIEDLWHGLDRQEKQWFLKYFKSQWLSYRVGIPKKNALKLLKLFASGQLASIEIANAPTYDATHSVFNIQLKDSPTVLTTDYLINATGSPLTLSESASPLLTNMSQDGTITANEWGGIQVDFATSKVMNKNQRFFDNLYAIGQLTAGVYFFTSVLALNVKHAHHVASQIADKIMTIVAYDKADNL